MRTCHVCQKTDKETSFYKGVRGICAEHWRNEMRLNRLAMPSKYKYIRKEKLHVSSVVVAGDALRPA
jgi:hypothetical protein